MRFGGQDTSKRRRRGGESLQTWLQRASIAFVVFLFMLAFTAYNHRRTAQLNTQVAAQIVHLENSRFKATQELMEVKTSTAKRLKDCEARVTLCTDRMTAASQRNDVFSEANLLADCKKMQAFQKMALLDAQLIS